MMNLKEFKETGHPVSLAQGCAAIGVSEEDFGPNCFRIWFYDGDAYIEELFDGRFHALIIRDEKVGSRDDVSAFLYFDWYITECDIEYTTSGLTILLNEWSKYEGIEPASADEMLFVAQQKPQRARTWKEQNRVVWLEWFIETWESVQRREDRDTFGGRA